MAKLTKQGDWEKAIAVAPAVSLSYWKYMCGRYAAHLGATPYGRAIQLASGETAEVVHNLCEDGHCSEALLPAVATLNGRFVSALDGACSFIILTSRRERRTQAQDWCRIGILNLVSDGWRLIELVLNGPRIWCTCVTPFERQVSFLLVATMKAALLPSLQGLKLTWRSHCRPSLTYAVV